MNELPNQKGTEEVNLNVNLLEQRPDKAQEWNEDLYLQYSRIKVHWKQQTRGIGNEKIGSQTFV